MIQLAIRTQRQQDFVIVENITRQAFWNLYCPGAIQHFIVHNIRKSVDFVPQLSMVAELNGQIVGHILYSLSKVTYSDGNIIQTVTFGPVSVRLDLQFKGIGSKLIKQSLSKAKKMGFKGVIILGYPHYYQRFGFKGSHEFKIKSVDNSYYIGMQVLQLQQNCFPKDKQGVFQYSQAFSGCIQNLQNFQGYDKKFQPRQKFKTLSQKIYNQVSSKKWGQPLNYEIKDVFNRQKLKDNQVI